MIDTALQPVRPHELDWETLGTHGLRRKVLRYDPDNRHVTSLVDIPTGWKGGGVAHFHHAFEEVYMVSGSVTVDGHHYWHADDYFYRPARIVHGHDEKSPEGARAVIRSDGPVELLLVHDPDKPVEYPLPGVDDPRGHIFQVTPSTLAWSTATDQPVGWQMKLLSADRSTGARTYLVDVPAHWSRGAATARKSIWEAMVTRGTITSATGDYSVGDYTWGPTGTECFDATACAAGCTFIVWEFPHDSSHS